MHHQLESPLYNYREARELQQTIYTATKDPAQHNEDPTVHN